MGKDLVQTKSKFTLRGKITGLGNPRFPSFEEGTMQNGKNKGKPFRKLNFGVQTSSTNLINVGMYDAEPQEVYMYNSEKKSGQKFKFAEWEKQKEKGYASLDVRVAYEVGEDGKAISHTYPSYVASKLIDDNFFSGDSVLVWGEITHSNGKTQDGRDTVFTNYKLKGIMKIDDIDFEDEKFTELSSFEQELVFVDATADKKNNQVWINGYVIDYKQDFTLVSYPINYGTEDGVDEDLVTLANNFMKKVKFGSIVHIFGNTWNKISTIEVVDDWGGKRQSINGKREKSVEVLGICRDKDGSPLYFEKEYTEQDFEDARKAKTLIEDTPKTEDIFGGKQKENPFGSSGKIFIDDSELPF